MFKKICSTLLALLTAFSLAACGTPKQDDPTPIQPDPDPGTETFEAEVWTLPSSVKVLREADCSA